MGGLAHELGKRGPYDIFHQFAGRSAKVEKKIGNIAILVRLNRVISPE